MQLGSPDMPLELWFITRMVIRNLNLYLDTLYSAFEMIALGHHHGAAHPWLDAGHAGRGRGALDEVIRAYEDVGMRVSYCFAVRDQNRLVYQADEEFVASLPTELRGPMQRWFDRFKLSLDDDMELFKSLHGAASQQAPGEDPAGTGQPALVLGQGADAAVRSLAQVRRADAHAPGGDRLPEGIRPAARRLHGGGVHRPLRHGGPQPDARPRRVAEREGHRAAGGDRHLRLPQLLLQLPPALGRGGAEPVRGKGINTAIGLDEAGINDDRDMLQEMKLVLRAHRVPGMVEDDVPTHGAGAAHGDRRRREDHALSARRSARWRSARAPTWC